MESLIVEMERKALQSPKNLLARVWSPVKSGINDQSFCKNGLGEGGPGALSGGFKYSEVSQ